MDRTRRRPVTSTAVGWTAGRWRNPLVSVVTVFTFFTMLMLSKMFTTITQTTTISTRIWCRLMATAAHTDETLAQRRHRAEQEGGDVPGWVMITLMTAGLVAALWVLAGDRFKALFDQAMNAVSGNL